MAQGGHHAVGYIVITDTDSTVEQGVNLGAQDKCLCATRARSEPKVLRDFGKSPWTVGRAGADYADYATFDRLRHHYLTHQRFELFDRGGCFVHWKYRFGHVGYGTGGAIEDFAQLFRFGRAHEHLEQKAIHLCL